MSSTKSSRRSTRAVSLVDAGPLIALFDADADEHAACVGALDDLVLPLTTTLAALTEAMHILHRIGGLRLQRRLLNLIERGDLVVATPSNGAWSAISEMMQRYADRPMDFPDATLVALADETGDTRIFTLDADFHIYRLSRGRRFTVIPA